MTGLDYKRDNILEIAVSGGNNETLLVLIY